MRILMILNKELQGWNIKWKAFKRMLTLNCSGFPAILVLVSRANCFRFGFTWCHNWLLQYLVQHLSQTCHHWQWHCPFKRKTWKNWVKWVWWVIMYIPEFIWSIELLVSATCLTVCSLHHQAWKEQEVHEKVTASRVPSWPGSDSSFFHHDLV